MAFVKEFTTGSRLKRSKEELKKAEELREKARDEDNQMVVGIFKNIEVPGGDLQFTYRKYKEDPYRSYHFEDGKEYTVPMGVAKHINNMTKVKQHAHLVDKDGKKMVGAGSYRQRYQFLSKEFM